MKGPLSSWPSSRHITEFEVVYLKIVVDDKEVVEIDKYNFIAKFGDTDMLESVRKDLGMS